MPYPCTTHALPIPLPVPVSGRPQRRLAASTGTATTTATTTATATATTATATTAPAASAVLTWADLDRADVYLANEVRWRRDSAPFFCVLPFALATPLTACFVSLCIHDPGHVTSRLVTSRHVTSRLVTSRRGQLRVMCLEYGYPLNPKYLPQPPESRKFAAA